MREEDIGQVTAIDKQVFPTMLPPINYHNEFHNALAHYVVACSKEKVLEEPADRRNVPGVLSWVNRVLGRSHATENETVELRQYIFGFAGLWMMADEAHIVNIAVREQCRRRGVGEL
jgi:ribosomal-protein-alanine N-acetyltransferase